MAPSPDAPPKLPGPIALLAYPGWGFPGVADAGYGFGRIFGWLGLEFLLLRPLQVTSALLQAKNSLMGGVSQLWSRYLHFALGPALGMFLLGVGLYYVLRFRGRSKLDVYPAASTLAHAWIPHTLWVAISVILVRFGVTHPILAPFPYRSEALTPVLTLVKGALEFGPVLLLGAVGVLPLLRGRRLPRPRGRKRPWVLAILAALVLTAAAERTGRHVATHWRAVRPVMLGDTLPPFSLSGPGGETLNDAAIEGKVTIVDFWATWCGPCVASMPYLAELYKEYLPRGLMFVSVNTEPDNLDGVRQFHSKHALPFPVYVDGGAFSSALKVNTLPTLIIIDKDGVVKHIHIGLTSMVTVKKELDALLSR